MNLSFGSRLKRVWNVFINNRDPTHYYYDAPVYSYRIDRPRFSGGNEKTIATAVYNRIALDVAAISVMHVILDSNNRFLSEVESDFNNCLKKEANIDQTGRAFLQDIVMSMLDEGCVAVVPIDYETSDNLEIVNNLEIVDDIQSLRVGKILEWRPSSVKVRIYNEISGQKEDIIVPKRRTAIIENPLYAVVNEKNSTMQRLIRKLSILDSIDEQNGSSKFNMIIQLPYSVRSELRKNQAEERLKSMETQLAASRYGIAYADATEKITQLNRPLDNNLMSQIEYLTNLLFSQLGITQSILDGTADEQTMLNYYNRTIEPIVSAIVDEMKRKFLSPKRIEKKESILFFRDPFKLVPVNQMAEIADKFTRNEIMSSNEIRQVVGLKPSDDPKADELRNKNLSEPKEKETAHEQTGSES